MPLITGISDRLMALELGHPIAEGTPEEVVRDPRVVASYLGTDEAAINRSGKPVPASTSVSADGDGGRRRSEPLTAARTK